MNGTRNAGENFSSSSSSLSLWMCFCVVGHRFRMNFFGLLLLCSIAVVFSIMTSIRNATFISCKEKQTLPQHFSPNDSVNCSSSDFLVVPAERAPLCTTYSVHTPHALVKWVKVHCKEERAASRQTKRKRDKRRKREQPGGSWKLYNCKSVVRVAGDDDAVVHNLGQHHFVCFAIREFLWVRIMFMFRVNDPMVWHYFGSFVYVTHLYGTMNVHNAKSIYIYRAYLGCWHSKSALILNEEDARGDVTPFKSRQTNKWAKSFYIILLSFPEKKFVFCVSFVLSLYWIGLKGMRRPSGIRVLIICLDWFFFVRIYAIRKCAIVSLR